MNTSRRSFLIKGGLSLAALPFAGSMLAGLTSSSAAYGEDLPACKESDTMPKTLKYCSNAKKPSAQCAERKKPEHKDHFCHNCQLYTKAKGEGDKEEGKCLLMTKCLVSGNGWCSSWVKKPG
jgi:hypothetical protein